MKVYLVSSGEYSDYGIDAIFSTRELAERYLAGNEKYDKYDLYVIEEWELDEHQHEALRPIWIVWIGLSKDSGKITSESRDVEVAPLNAHVPPEQDVSNASEKIEHVAYGLTRDLYGNYRRSTPITTLEWRENYSVRSYVSAEHARKLAVEAYQAYLRARALEP